MSDLNFGQLIDTPQNRDAVHVAVAPMTANEQLFPGQHIGLVEGSQTIATRDAKPIGIVDPYLLASVPKGAQFWLFLYPKTVTGLRHEWSHPSFTDSVNPAPLDAKSEAEKWLREFASTWVMDFDHMVACAKEGDAICAGTDFLQSDLGDDLPRFWRNIETLTGKTFNESHRENAYFRCAC